MIFRTWSTIYFIKSKQHCLLQIVTKILLYQSKSIFSISLKLKLFLILNKLYHCLPYFVMILFNSFICIDLQYKVGLFFMALITTCFLEIALCCLQLILYFYILSWAIEKQSIIYFLHLKDVSRILFIAIRSTISLNLTTFYMDSENPCMRLHFFPFFISSFNFFSSR